MGGVALVGTFWFCAILIFFQLAYKLTGFIMGFLYLFYFGWVSPFSIYPALPSFTGY